MSLVLALGLAQAAVPPAVGADAAAVADQLRTLHALAADPAAPAAALATAGHLHQRIHRALSKDDALRADVLAALDPAMRPRVEALSTATGRIARTVTKARRTVPAWTITAPPPVAQLRAWYDESAAASGVPWTVLAAVHLVETRFGRLQGVSHAGAMGPMQFIPETWARFGNGGDILDPHDAIMAAGRHLSAHGAARDLGRALWHYNQSPSYVSAVLAYHERLAEDPALLGLLLHWQVYVRTVEGLAWMPEGTSLAATEAAASWCARADTWCEAEGG